ncbi:hypothetical protein [Negativicoccus succinicivorans]|nr:hypothetical protein [Negativicoccus succinicivorans]
MMHVFENELLVAVHGGALVIERAELAENKNRPQRSVFLFYL